MNAKKLVVIFLMAAVMLSSCQPPLFAAKEAGLASWSEQQSDTDQQDFPENLADEKSSDFGISLDAEPEPADPADDGVEDEPSDQRLSGQIPSENKFVAPEPEAINPLTGLPVENPENLLLPPALISVTNFPPTARPQAGLSFSPIVFELYIGEGMTRYLAVFYGDYPQASIQQNNEDVEGGMTESIPAPGVGPIRSGRLPYEHIRKLFNGFIVMASAYSKVAAQLSNYVNEFGDDQMDPNSAMIHVDKLQEIAKENQEDLGSADHTGMRFDSLPPEGGKTAHSLWIFFAHKNQVFWRYNLEDGTYHRWQDNADGSTFIEQTDRLTGDPLAFENVIVLYADHEVENTYLIDIGLLYVIRGKALLFRDETVQEIYWTTASEEYERTTGKLRPIRFCDAEGNPIPLKPGQTWIELMPPHLAFWETVDSEVYNQLAAGRKPGSGYWGLYFKLKY